MSGLADVILGNPDDTARVPMLRQGVVTAVNPLSVLVGAATTSQLCRTLVSYVPTVGETVSVLVISGDRLVLGKASQSGGAPGPDLSQFVRKTGDTMTGGLTIQSHAGLGLALITDNAHIGWYDDAGTTRRGYAQGASTGLTLFGEPLLYLNSTLSYVRVQGQIDIGWMPSYSGFIGVSYAGSGDYLIMTNAQDTFISSPGSAPAGVHIRGGKNAPYELFVSGGGTHTFTGYVTLTDGYRLTSNGGYDGYWGNTAYLAQKASNGDRTGYSIHPGGVAKTIGMIPNNGYVNFWNEDASWYADLYCNTITQVSQGRGKIDVAQWPPRSAGSAVMGAANRLSLIDVISYRIRPELALIDAETMEVHECGPDSCGGGPDEPCQRVKDWSTPQIGVLIEDLATVLPEAVGLDPDGNPGGMRLGSMIGFLLAVCQEQEERLAALEHDQEVTT